MRLVLGVLMFIIMAFGFLIGVVYPFAAGSQQGYELARWQALDGAGGFREFETLLPAAEEQILVHVDVATDADAAVDGDAIVLTLTATSGQRTEFAQVFSLGDLPSTAREFRFEAATLHFIRDEPYRFVFTEGEMGVPFSSVELVLTGGTYEYDESVPPIGYGMIAIGTLGMFLTNRRKGGRKAAQPEPPKWGRG